MTPRVALFVAPTRSSARVVTGLARAGYTIAAVVARGRRINLGVKFRARRRSEPDWSFAAQFAAAGIAPPLICGPVVDEPASLIAALRPHRPDLLVSVYFPRRIPAEVIAAFPRGAVNIHPARLPDIPGSQPIHALVAADLWREYGEATLHVMDAGLDRGAIIARARLAEAAWNDRTTYQTAIGGAIEALAAEALPRWLEGRVAAVPQDSSAPRRWAGLLRAPVEIGADWTAARLERAWSFLGGSPGLGVRIVDDLIRLPGTPRQIGPPSGAAPALDHGRLSFDIADARIRTDRAGWLTQQRAKRARHLAWVGRTPLPPVTLTYASDEPTPGPSAKSLDTDDKSDPTSSV